MPSSISPIVHLVVFVVGIAAMSAAITLWLKGRSR
jgi:hypothetical protein